MVKILWIFTIVCSLIAAFLFVITLTSSSKTAVQDAALSLCIAVIPYILARSVSEIKK